MELLEAAKALLQDVEHYGVASSLVSDTKLNALKDAVKALEPPEVLLKERFQVVIWSPSYNGFIAHYFAKTHEEAMEQGKKVPLTNGHPRFRIRRFYEKAD